MFDKLMFTCNAVFPIVLTILTGYLLKTLKVFNSDFFKSLNKLSFRCCLPVMLFMNVYNVKSLSQMTSYGKVCLFCFVVITSTFLIAAVCCGFFMKDNRQKGVMVQAAYRSNNAIIGLSLVTTLVNGEANAIAIGSILSSLFIPLFNILAVLSLTIFIKDQKGHKISIAGILKKIITNPLIIGCGLGFAALIIRHFIPLVPVDPSQTEGISFLYEIRDPVTQAVSPACKVFTIRQNLPFLYATLEMLGKCATTVALIALGGNFTFSAIAKLKHLIITGTLLRVLIVPAISLIAAYKLGFREMEFPGLIALIATPVAVSSVPMASEMNNDDELAGQLVVWTSIASAFTLFGIIFACTQAGIFKV